MFKGIITGRTAGDDCEAAELFCSQLGKWQGKKIPRCRGKAFGLESKRKSIKIEFENRLFRKAPLNPQRIPSLAELCKKRAPFCRNDEAGKLHRNGRRTAHPLSAADVLIRRPCDGGNIDAAMREKILVLRCEKDADSIGRHCVVCCKLASDTVLQCKNLNDVTASIIDAGTPIPLHKSV